MHQCICKKMIWQPKCQAFGSNGQFLPIFLHYCSNWMAIMYQLLWYIKDIDLKPELIATLEKAALSKLNQLHTGRKSTYNVKNLNWHETSLMASPFIQSKNNETMDITIRSYKKRNDVITDEDND